MIAAGALVVAAVAASAPVRTVSAEVPPLTVLWHKSFNAQAVERPLVRSGMVVLRLTREGISVVQVREPASGAVRWERAIPGDVLATTVGSNRVFVSHLSGDQTVLLALSKVNGRVLNRRLLGAEWGQVGWLEGADERLYVVGGGTLGALTPTLQTIWSTPTFLRVNTPGDGRLYGFGAKDATGDVRCLTRLDGATGRAVLGECFSQDEDRYWAELVGVDPAAGVVVLSEYDVHRVTAYRTSDLSEVWSTVTGYPRVGYGATAVLDISHHRVAVIYMDDDTFQTQVSSVDTVSGAVRCARLVGDYGRSFGAVVDTSSGRLYGLEHELDYTQDVPVQAFNMSCREVGQFTPAPNARALGMDVGNGKVVALFALVDTNGSPAGRYSLDAFR